LRLAGGWRLAAGSGGLLAGSGGWLWLALAGSGWRLAKYFGFLSRF